MDFQNCIKRVIIGLNSRMMQFNINNLFLPQPEVTRSKKNAIFEDVHGQVELIISSLQGNFEMLKKSMSDAMNGRSCL